MTPVQAAAVLVGKMTFITSGHLHGRTCLAYMYVAVERGRFEMQDRKLTDLFRLDFEGLEM